MFISPNHVRLVASCYPAAPLQAAPDFKPNAQELSRLTYYGSNRPGKLTKLGGELEKRAQSDARRAGTGNAKSRASLLITLSILKALCAECRRDISLFARSVVASIEYTLSALASDLEVTSRAASVFTAYTTYTDGKSNSVDETLGRSYLAVLQKFATLSTWSGKGDSDSELRNRTRLVGLVALTGAISSDALYVSIESAKAQVAVIVPALLHNANQAGLMLLKEQEALVEESQNASPYLSEFQPQRPVSQRRAASIHHHVDGEAGPLFSDVTYAALRAAKTLLARSDGPQVGTFLQSLFYTLDAEASWGDMGLCCWLALNITNWTQYQHRYAVPIQLIAKLVDTKSTDHSTQVQKSLIAMITAVFSAHTPIANLSTSDALTSLIGVILRRIALNPHDPLLVELVKCVSSLGTQLYYADQIHDLAEELIHRLISVQINGRIGNETNRQEGMRCLIACLAGLIQVATHPNELHDGTKNRTPSNGVANGSQARNPRGGTAGSISGRRNPISPAIWQETLALLCEADYGIRADYARTLAIFIKSEIPREVDSENSIFRTGRKSLDYSNSDETTRFLHALHASAFTLAVSPSLGLSSNPPSDATSHSSTQGLTDSEAGAEIETPNANINIIESTPVGTPIGVGSSQSGSLPMVERKLQAEFKRGSSRSRTASIALSLLERVPAQLIDPAPSPATPSDYTHLVAILSSAYERTPARALLTGVPMVFALDMASCTPVSGADEATVARRHALREVVVRVWGVIGRVFESPEIRQVSENALESLPRPLILPPLESPHDNFCQPVDAPLQFSAYCSSQYSDPSSTLRPVIDPDAVLPALATNPILRQVTSLDRQGVMRRFAMQWSASIALNESVEKFPAENGSRADGTMPFLKISPALMHIDNKSLQSLARSSRNVGVGDLREALEGRTSANRSATALGYTPSLSSVGHTSIGDGPAYAPPRPRFARAMKGTNGEVKDILNKLGIGKQQSARLKGVFRSPLQPKASASESTSSP